MEKKVLKWWKIGISLTLIFGGIHIFLVPETNIQLFKNQLNGSQMFYELLKKSYYGHDIFSTLFSLSFLITVILSLAIVYYKIKYHFKEKSDE